MKTVLGWAIGAALVITGIVFLATYAGEQRDNCPTEDMVQEHVHPNLKEELPDDNPDTGILTCPYHTSGSAAEKVDVIVQIHTFSSEQEVTTKVEDTRLQGLPAFADADRSQLTTDNGGYLIVSYLPVEGSTDQLREEVDLGYPQGGLLCIATINRPHTGDHSMEEAAKVLAKDACNRAS